MSRLSSRQASKGRASLVRMARARMMWSVLGHVSSLALLASCAGPPARSGTASDSAAAAGGSNSASGAGGATTGGASAGGSTSGAWRSLLDGPNAGAHWRAYRADSMPTGWSLAGGVLTKEGEREDIISRDQYGDFEFDFDWKLSKGGNAGVFYRATEEYDKVYWSGTEYQLLDDANHPDGKSRLTSAAAAYGLYPAPAGVVKPADEWNSSRIVVRGSHVEHWLNGQKVVEYDLGSPDWEAKVKAAKFVEYPHYGRATRGHIAIQGDHSGTLQLRNLRIRELSS